MKRIILILSFLILVGCSSNNVPDGFTETELETKAESIVQLLNENKLEEVFSMFRTDLQSLVKIEDLDKIIQTKFDQIGEFKKIDQIVITDTKDPNTSELYAVVIIVSQHKEGKSTYTLSFNKDLEIVGFYIK